jgi:hypothetical protein
VEPAFQKLDQVLAGVACAAAPAEIGVIPLSFCLATRAASETTASGWIAREPVNRAREITERFHRINYGHMEVRVTVTDPKAYTHPFTVTLNEYLEPAGELMDFVCLENDTGGPQFLGK